MLLQLQFHFHLSLLMLSISRSFFPILISIDLACMSAIFFTWSAIGGNMVFVTTPPTRANSFWRIDTFFARDCNSRSEQVFILYKKKKIKKP
ncbi:hypothetical protein F4808DRAFT_259441 [Astrocystis sublimbata]|nr:hypothetical protein F4808DRAFT_259441 [Astrocystis sublimbata]